MARGLHIKQKRDVPIGSIVFWTIFATLFAACAWYGYRFYMKGELPPVPIPVAQARQDVDEATVSQDEKDSHHVEPTQPRYLSVPSINITNSRVHAMGVKDNGELDTPHNIFDTGWYSESARPGDGSSALLMDGHNGGPTKDGVFKNLPSLKNGSDIIIERGDGQKFTYEVKEVKVVTLEDLNNGGMKEMSHSIDPSVQGLNVISCTGNWVPAMQTYDKRVVVRAALKE